jgi:hypothetical protein
MPRHEVKHRHRAGRLEHFPTCRFHSVLILIFRNHTAL